MLVEPLLGMVEGKGGDMNPIVLATDGSPSAERATQVAVDLAREGGARLLVVSAWRAPSAIYSSSPQAMMPAVERKELHRATAAARAGVELAEAQGVEAESFVRNGEPVAVISQTARYGEASLVVVGSHGWGPVRRLVLGSVSARLLRHAPCPVLVVREDHTEAAVAPAEQTEVTAGV